MNQKKTDSNDEKSPEVRAAEPVVWSVYRRELEARGNAEETLYLQHLLKAIPKEVQAKGDYKHVPFDIYQRLSDYSARYNVQTGEQMSWIFHALMEEPGRRMEPQAGIAAAEAAAQPPEDAVQELAEYQEQGGNPVFVVRWTHHVSGVPVERDFIQALVNGRTEKVFAVHRKWHEIDEKPKVR